jgi:hypothetical protein
MSSCLFVSHPPSHGNELRNTYALSRVVRQGISESWAVLVACDDELILRDNLISLANDQQQVR